jgi:uncharacterized membrane protein YvbJ
MGKYKDYESAFIRCPNCSSYIDQDSMLCKKCGYDYDKGKKNDKIKYSKNRYKSKRHY